MLYNSQIELNYSNIVVMWENWDIVDSHLLELIMDLCGFIYEFDNFYKQRLNEEITTVGCLVGQEFKSPYFVY